MRCILCFLPALIGFFAGCKSSVKQQEDSLYSRHLQRHVGLTVITTTMPDKKEKMNLLLLNHGYEKDFSGKKFSEAIRAAKIIDSLFKKKLIQPVVLVAFDGKETDYGLEESMDPGAKQFKKFNAFVTNELYPFSKKKAVLRKFNSVAICGFGKSALSSFDIAWNNDDKIQKTGLFFPDSFSTAAGAEEALQTIEGFRKRPRLQIWMKGNPLDSNTMKLKKIISSKPGNISFFDNKEPMVNSSHDFAEFLIWAFPG